MILRKKRLPHSSLHRFCSAVLHLLPPIRRCLFPIHPTACTCCVLPPPPPLPPWAPSADSAPLQFLLLTCAHCSLIRLSVLSASRGDCTSQPAFPCSPSEIKQIPRKSKLPLCVLWTAHHLGQNKIRLCLGSAYGAGDCRFEFAGVNSCVCVRPGVTRPVQACPSVYRHVQA